MELDDHHLGRLAVQSITGLKWKKLKKSCSCVLAARQGKLITTKNGKKQLFKNVSKLVRNLHRCARDTKRTKLQRLYLRVIKKLDSFKKDAKASLKEKARKKV